MNKINAFTVFAPEGVRDAAFGERCECNRRAAAVGVGHIEIPDVGAVPSDHNVPVVRRPNRVGGMLDFDELLNGQCRFSRGLAARGLRAQVVGACQGGCKKNCRDQCALSYAHSASHSSWSQVNLSAAAGNGVYLETQFL